MLYGYMTKEVLKQEDYEVEFDHEKTKRKNDKIIAETKFMIFPGNKKKKAWDVWVMILLLYIAIFLPIKVSFVDEVTQVESICDLVIDVSFFVDIVMTFFVAFNRDNVLISDRAEIAKTYFKGWFFIDVFTVIPFQVFEKLNKDIEEASNSKALRLARIPRLYRLLRILRLSKLLRVFK